MTAEEPESENQLNQAWREIIDNYGERVEITKPPVHPPPARPEPVEYQPIVETDPLGEIFIPPNPGPASLPEPRRRLAWFGVLGIPALLFISLLAAVRLPSWAIGFGAVWFVAGLGYLVATMDSSRRHDDPDDGAVV